MITFEDFQKVEIKTGTIIEVAVFKEARNPSYKLSIDFGAGEIKCSSAQITTLYTKEELIGKQILAVVNFPKKQIANFFSECLVLGVKHGDGVVLITTDKKVENGEAVY